MKNRVFLKTARFFLFSALLILGAGGFPSSVAAQQAALTVLVQNESGSGVSGARIVLVDQLTGKETEFTGETGSNGKALFNPPSGSYRIRADYLGYSFWGGLTKVPAEDPAKITLPVRKTTVNVYKSYQSSRIPLAGRLVKVFTEDRKELGLTAISSSRGSVTFDLPDRPYLFNTEYLDQEYSSINSGPQKYDILVSHGQISVSVTSSSGILTSQKVMLFDAAATYLEQFELTDQSGRAAFLLPPGQYTFRVDYLGMRFFSNLVSVAGEESRDVVIQTGGGRHVLTVRQRSGDPLPDLPVYLFDASEQYLGQTAKTDGAGKVEFYLPNGAFKFRTDMMGYSFWSDLYSMPEQPEGKIDISMNEVKCSVLLRIEDRSIPLEGKSIELLNEEDLMIPVNPPLMTDINGEVIVRLAEKPYYFRLAYLGQYWKSEKAVWSDALILIEQKVAEVRVLDRGKPLVRVPVSLFAADGRYLNVMEHSDANGSATFDLPSGKFRFRVDIMSQEFWSPVVSENSTVINIDHQELHLKVFLNGRAMKEAFVFLYDTSEKPKYLGHSGETDRKGRAKFYVPEGKYILRVDQMGKKYWSKTFEVRKDQPNRHSVEVSKWRVGE